jgi:hypothetical protein
MPTIVYLSPHLDDAVLSCGAVIWEQVHQERKQVEVWTIFAGDPPVGEMTPFALSLHERWQTAEGAPETRRREDTLACQRLGCQPVHLGFPDCIYRFNPADGLPRISRNEELFIFDPERDGGMVDKVGESLRKRLVKGTQLVVPLGVGDHIDHWITRLAAERLDWPLWYYADFPYAGQHPEEIGKKTVDLRCLEGLPISSRGLRAWQTAASAYVSQVSSFWPSIREMENAIEKYARCSFGHCFWTSSG